MTPVEGLTKSEGRLYSPRDFSNAICCKQLFQLLFPTSSHLVTMYSVLVKILEDTKFKYNIWNICFFVTVLCLILIVKKILKIRSYYNAFPSRKVTLFNVFGNIIDFLSNRTVKNLDFNVCEYMSLFILYFRKQDL